MKRALRAGGRRAAGGVAAALLACSASGQITQRLLAVADAFVCAGSPAYQGGADLTGLNFGGAGTLAIAPASAEKGPFQSVLKFSLTNATAVFDATYGTNGWAVRQMRLQLTSNWGKDGAQPNNPIFNPIAGGPFAIAWMAADDWLEGTGTPSLPTTDGVTFASLPAFLARGVEPLGTFAYAPPGPNVPVVWPLVPGAAFADDLRRDDEVSFHFCATDEPVGYLFNSYRYGRGNEPVLDLVAVPLPRILTCVRANEGIELTGQGAVLWPHEVQASSAGSWTPLGTVTSDAAGTIRYTETNPASMRLFRFVP